MTVEFPVLTSFSYESEGTDWYTVGSRNLESGHLVGPKGKMISNSQVTGSLPYQCEETTSHPAHKHSLLPLDPQMPRVKSQHAPEDRCSLRPRREQLLH